MDSIELDEKIKTIIYKKNKKSQKIKEKLTGWAGCGFLLANARLG